MDAVLLKPSSHVLQCNADTFSDICIMNCSCRLGTSIVAAQVKPPHGAPESHMGAGSCLLPANDLGKAAKDGPSAGLFTTPGGNPA